VFDELQAVNNIQTCATHKGNNRTCSSQESQMGAENQASTSATENHERAKSLENLADASAVVVAPT